MGELDRNVDLDGSRGHPIEHLDVLVTRGNGVTFLGDTLTQQVQGGAVAATGNIASRPHRRLDGFAGHEARRKLPSEPVAPDEVEYPWPLGEPEQALAHDHR